MRARLGIVAAVCLGAAGCGVHPPGRVETAVANAVKHRVAVRGARDRDPLPRTAANLEAGKAQFLNYCSVCHGVDGRNGGVIFAQNMAPPVPPLDAPEVQRYTDGQLHAVIRDGIFPSGMPAWRSVLGDEQTWQIVQYVRSLPATRAGP